MDYVDDLVTLLPELILVALVLVIITVDLFLPRAHKWLLTPLTVAGLVLAGAACVVVWDINETVYAGFYVVDDLGVFLKATTIVIGILSTLFAPAYLLQRRHGALQIAHLFLRRQPHRLGERLLLLGGEVAHPPGHGHRRHDDDGQHPREDGPVDEELGHGAAAFRALPGCQGHRSRSVDT